METLGQLKLLLVQTRLFWADAQANRQQLEALVRSQADGSDIVVFPETFTSGFLGDAGAEAESMRGATCAWMKTLAVELGCVLCGSVAISTGRGRVNRFLWARPDGRIQFYDKRHLFSYGGEDKRYVAGRERRVFRYRGWRICPQVCYDLRFPVWCRNRGDYDALIFVANWPQPRTPAWSALLRARAIENQCYVVGVNRCGTDPRGLEYVGASAVFGPSGECLLDMGSTQGCAAASIELAELAAVRERLPFQRDADEFSLS